MSARRHVDDDELGAALRALGRADLEWPEAPDVGAGRHAARSARPESRRSLAAAWRDAAAARVLLIAAASSRSRPRRARPRGALIWDLGGPCPGAADIAACPRTLPGPEALGAALARGGRDQVGLRPPLPASLGPPDEVGTHERRRRHGSRGSRRVASGRGTPPIPGTPWGASCCVFPGEARDREKRLRRDGNLRVVEVARPPATGSRRSGSTLRRGRARVPRHGRRVALARAGFVDAVRDRCLGARPPDRGLGTCRGNRSRPTEPGTTRPLACTKGESPREREGGPDAMRDTIR